MKQCVCGQYPEVINYPVQIKCDCGLSTQSSVYDYHTESDVWDATEKQWEDIVNAVTDIR